MRRILFVYPGQLSQGFLPQFVDASPSIANHFVEARALRDETQESRFQGSVFDGIILYRLFMGDSRRFPTFSTAEGMG
jgi:hypothetical protein